MIERRELFRILTATAVARAGAEPPRFFSKADYETVDQLCSMLLPSDADGPGAREAEVAGYIDTVLYHADPRVRQQWTRGIAAVNEAAQRDFGNQFAGCAAAQKVRIMNLLAENEAAPQTELQRFFTVLKRTAVEAFSTSTAGKQFLGYRGDTTIASFSGCTHPEHQR